MTWYQEGQVFFFDADVCRLMFGRCIDPHECDYASGPPDLYGACIDPWMFAEFGGDCDSSCAAPDVWESTYDRCNQFDPECWDNCHAPPTIPGRVIMHAKVAL